LAKNEKYWNMVKEDSKKYLLSGNVKDLFSSQILDACVMESARMNTHVFALDRKPKTNTAVLGDYYIGETDCIALCEPMMMVYDCSPFEDPLKYNPDRFLGDKAASKAPKSVMTWGAGVHVCPGKQFAIYEIKTAMALLTNNFEQFVFQSAGKNNYFSPSAFLEKTVKVNLTPLPEKDCTDLVTTPSRMIMSNNKPYKVECFGTKHSGWLIRDFLDRSEQADLYKYTINMSKDSKEHTEILSAPVEKAYPITYHQLVYTGESNCDKPIKLLEFADKIWSLLLKNKEQIKFDTDRELMTFDSVYAQLFANESKMGVHKDEHVDWGVSISLGASCEFIFGSDTIILNSGDIFIADFSKVDHGVKQICTGTEPGWFDESEDPIIKTFGRSRCSIQIRDVSHANNKLISTVEFKNMLQKY
jgi:alkylated DNA repair dioxygenase AlkB